MNILDLFYQLATHRPREHVATLHFPEMETSGPFHSYFLQIDRALLLFGAEPFGPYRDVPVELVVRHWYAGIVNFSPLLCYVPPRSVIYGQSFHDIPRDAQRYGKMPAGEIRLFGWRIEYGPHDLEPLPAPPFSAMAEASTDRPTPEADR